MRFLTFFRVLGKPKFASNQEEFLEIPFTTASAFLHTSGISVILYAAAEVSQIV